MKHRVGGRRQTQGSLTTAQSQANFHKPQNSIISSQVLPQKDPKQMKQPRPVANSLKSPKFVQINLKMFNNFVDGSSAATNHPNFEQRR